jgi:hypothetical protein
MNLLRENKKLGDFSNKESQIIEKLNTYKKKEKKSLLKSQSKIIIKTP